MIPARRFCTWTAKWKSASRPPAISRRVKRRRVREHLAFSNWHLANATKRFSPFALRLSLPAELAPSRCHPIPSCCHPDRGLQSEWRALLFAVSTWHLAKALHPEPLATDYRLLATGVNYPLTTIHYPLFFPLRDGLLSS